MIQRLLGIKDDIETDASDALATAVCHTTRKKLEYA